MAGKLDSYSDKLRQPIPAKERPQGTGALAKFLRDRMDRLLVHYNIRAEDPDRWFLLSLLLAMDHIPGIDTDLAGRPRTLTGHELQLISDVERLRNNGHTVREACELLSADADYEESPESLGKRYFDTLRLVRKG